MKCATTLKTTHLKSVQPKPKIEVRMICTDDQPCTFHNIECKYPQCACGWGEFRRRQEARGKGGKIILE